jgi:putative membrane protein insertion efficiency factor
MRKLLKLYKKFISFPVSLVAGPGCRFSPTCSEYASQAITKFGLVRGGKLALSRFFSCHPYSKRNYFDPVPNKLAN